MQIDITVGDQDLTFEAGHEDLNRFINEQTMADKIGPAFNFLMRTVTAESKDALKKLTLTDDQKPKGLVVLQIAGLITQELGGDVTVAIKKPKASPSESIRMVGSNFN